MTMKTSIEFRQRRAAAVRRCRARQARGAAVYPVEVDGDIYNLLVRLERLDPDKTTDRQAVADALGRLLRRALAALMREAHH